MALKPRQTKALAALLETGTISAAADAAGVSRDTLGKWMQEDDFRAALRATEDESIRTMTIRLTAKVDSAIDKVFALIEDPNTPPSVQLRAADTILQRVLELRELSIVEDRLSAIETALAVRNGR